jgi:hypothetical protein
MVLCARHFAYSQFANKQAGVIVMLSCPLTCPQCSLEFTATGWPMS